MKNNITPLIIVSLVLGILAMICLAISIFFQEGNNIFLMIGLASVTISLIISLIARKMGKDDK